LAAIDAIPPLPGCPYVFYNPATGNRWCDVSAPWEKARAEAGFPWIRVRDLRPAFGIEASEMGAPMHYIQSALGHGSVAVTERYYAKHDPRSGAKQPLRVIEAGRQGQKMGIKTGTAGD
jgi:integrase